MDGGWPVNIDSELFHRIVLEPNPEPSFPESYQFTLQSKGTDRAMVGNNEKQKNPSEPNNKGPAAFCVHPVE